MTGALPLVPGPAARWHGQPTHFPSMQSNTAATRNKRTALSAQRPLTTKGAANSRALRHPFPSCLWR